MKPSSAFLKSLLVLGTLTFGLVTGVSAQGSIIIRRPIHHFPPTPYPYPTPVNQCSPSPAGLVGWWPGEGNANDVVGGNNGALEGGISFSPGEVGQAFFFNNTNADVKIPAGSSLDVGSGNGLTLEAWINPSDISQRHPLFEWNVGDGATYWGVHFYIDPVSFDAGPGALYANIVDTNGFWHQISTGAGVVTTNVFQHVVLTYDKASGVATIYCNGLEVAQQNLGSFTPLTTYDLYLGKRPLTQGETYVFAGLLDEPSVYSRALSSNEVAALYTAGSAGKCPLPSHGFLIDIDIQGVYGVTSNASVKAGFAAIGQTTNDYWNFYTRDDPGAPGGVRSSGAVSNLLLADKTPTQVGMAVSNSPGAWSSDSTDPMYVGYVYPFSGNMTITVANLPDGQYEILPYSRDGSFEATVGGVSYGIKQSEDPAATGMPAWTEGVQYVRFSGVQIAGGQPLVLTVRPGTGGYATISGLQITSSTVTNAPNCVAAPSGLIGWWPAEGNAMDIVSANNGVAQNITYTNGIVGQAFACDPESFSYGTYVGVQIPDSPAYVLTNSLSIEGWIRPRGDGYTIFWRGDNRPGLDPYVLSMQDNNNLRFYIEDESGAYAFVGADLIYNQWTHVVATLDGGTGTMSLYINGALADQTNTPVRPFGNLIPEDAPGVGIGNVNDGGNNFPFIGDIDEISLYNRALSAAEAQALCHAGSAGKCAGPFPPGIVAPPANQTTVQGSNVVFSVGVDGTGPFSYQWSFNGTNIAGATNATLTLTNLHPYQSGSYAVTITTPYGTITSSGAGLTVVSQDILIYKYGGVQKIITAGQAFSYAYAGQLFLVPDNTNGLFVGWAKIKGKKQFWVNPLPEYLWITIPGASNQTFTVLGQAGQAIDTNGCPNIWSDLYRGQNKTLTIGKKKYFSFPNTLANDTTHVFPDSQTGTLVLSEASAKFNFMGQATQDANNNGQTLTDLVNALTQSLAGQGYQEQ